MHDHQHNSKGQLPSRFARFLPLIIIFLVISGVTAAINFIVYEPELGQIMRTFMGSFFAVFGLFKVFKLKSFAKAYQEYDVIARRSYGYAIAYPFLELALAVAYFINFEPVITNWITLIIMLIGAWGVFLKLRLREEITCACLGTVFKLPMTWVTLVEDLLMAVMAIIMLIML